ncbi:35843_t:CDS:2, partial [Racocetra persica]
KECIHCGALHWLDECVQASLKKTPKFGKCCHHGKVKLALLQEPSLPLRQIFEGQNASTIDQSVFCGQALYTFQIQSGTLLPESNMTARNLNPQTSRELQEILRKHHTFYSIYQQAHEIFAQAKERGASDSELAFIVDAWASTEQNRLRYLRSHQAILHADMYQGLADIVGNIANQEMLLNNLDQRIVLPSTHIGSHAVPAISKHLAWKTTVEI